MSSSNFQDLRIPVDRLEIGMHVVGIDCPWEETNFMLQSFIIETQDDIRQVKSQCREVVVQVRAEQVAQLRNPAPTSSTGDDSTEKTEENLPPDQLRPVTTERVEYLNQVEFERAVESSRLTFQSARKMASSVMDGLRAGQGLNIDECRNQVENIVDGVLANKDALRFLSMIKNKDDYTAEHSINVCILCATFARHLGLLEFEIKVVALCGLLHDVGKSQIPDEVLNKPGRFTKEEAHIMAEHTTYGRNILMSTEGDQRHAVDVALTHHERVDGNGYPRCLRANQIPFYSKLVAIVDAYDAMTSERCYGKPKTSYKALKIIDQNAGTQFDRKLATEFIKCIGFYSAGVLVELETGSLAVVLKANDEKADRPSILIVTNEDGQRLRKPIFLDLTAPEHQTIKIKYEVPNRTGSIDVKDYISQKLFN